MKSLNLLLGLILSVSAISFAGDKQNEASVDLEQALYEELKGEDVKMAATIKSYRENVEQMQESGAIDQAQAKIILDSIKESNVKWFSYIFASCDAVKAKAVGDRKKQRELMLNCLIGKTKSRIAELQQQEVELLSAE